MTAEAYDSTVASSPGSRGWSRFTLAGEDCEARSGADGLSSHVPVGLLCQLTPRFVTAPARVLGSHQCVTTTAGKSQADSP